MHIVPLVVGDALAAVSLCEAALRRGVFAQAIRPPTVAPGSSRLRLATMASHTAEELAGAARILGEAARELDLNLATLPLQAAAAAVAPAHDERPELEPELDFEPSARAPVEPSAANAPFDLERETLPPSDPSDPARETSGAGAPFDLEREEYAVSRAA